MITASGRMNLKNTTALLHQSFFGKNDPKGRMLLYGVLILSALLFQILMSRLSDKENSFAWVVVLCLVALGLFLCYCYFLLPRLMYRKSGAMQDAVNRYEFGPEGMTVISQSGAAMKGESQFSYDALVKVAETAEYFFLYNTGSSAFVVEKATIEGGSYEELRELLIGRPSTQYLACRW